MSSVRLIKRYANRKLYDTSRSCYVTLDEIGAMIKDGEEIRIIDNQTKEDLTSVTMAQILLEDERRHRRGRPLTAMRSLIEQSGELIQRRLTEPVHQIRHSVEESVNRLLKTGEERAAETRAQLQTWIDQNTQALEELQVRLDERIKHLVGGVTLLAHLQEEMARIRERLERVEAHLGLQPPESGEEGEGERPEALRNSRRG